MVGTKYLMTEKKLNSQIQGYRCKKKKKTAELNWAKLKLTFNSNNSWNSTWNIIIGKKHKRIEKWTAVFLLIPSPNRELRDGKKMLFTYYIHSYLKLITLIIPTVSMYSAVWIHTYQFCYFLNMKLYLTKRITHIVPMYKLRKK